MANVAYTATETQLNIVTGFNVGLTCATGYASVGTPTAVECSAQGGAYTYTDPCVGKCPKANTTPRTLSHTITRHYLPARFNLTTFMLDTFLTCFKQKSLAPVTRQMSRIPSWRLSLTL